MKKGDGKGLQAPQAEHGHDAQLRAAVELQLADHENRHDAETEIDGAGDGRIGVGAVHNDFRVEALALAVADGRTVPEVADRRALKEELEEEVTRRGDSGDDDAPDHDAHFLLRGNAQQEDAHAELEEERGYEVEELAEPPVLLGIS